MSSLILRLIRHSNSACGRSADKKANYCEPDGSRKQSPPHENALHPRRLAAHFSAPAESSPARTIPAGCGFKRTRWLQPCQLMAVRPEGANHQWRKIPPGELSINPVADERLRRV